MSLEWDEKERAIEKLIASEGVENYHKWSIIRQAMIRKHDLAENREWQRKHLTWLLDWAGWRWKGGRVLEIGGGIGDFAALMTYWYPAMKYSILDLPSVHKIQKYRWGNRFEYLTDIAEIAKVEWELVIAMWSLSEFDDCDKTAIMDAVGEVDGFFIFQMRHDTGHSYIYPAGWFSKMTKTNWCCMAPVGELGSWYMFVKANDGRIGFGV